MNLQLSQEDEAFRDEVLRFLNRHLTSELKEATRKMTSVYSDRELAFKWQAILHERGWVAPSWPTQYGGCDWSVSQKYIFSVEMARAGAPPLSPMGIKMCGPVLIGHGTEEQKERYLPRILSGADFWCQGYSEPHAGSDLATLSMSAVEDGENLICNGQKIWVTHANEANMCFCLVRTHSSGKPQEGITFLLIDMTSPGVTVDPIVMLAGEHIQNSIFFNDVVVPKANIVGQIHDGWTVAKYLLEFERGGSSYGPALLARMRQLREEAIEQNIQDQAVFSRISEIETSIRALEAAELRMISTLSQGGSPGTQASMMKILGTELAQSVTEIALDIYGPWTQPYQPHHTRPGGPVHSLGSGDPSCIGPATGVTASSRYFNKRAGSIYAGSNEIQRNILAKAQLKL